MYDGIPDLLDPETIINKLQNHDLLKRELQTEKIGNVTLVSDSPNGIKI